jgi:hypothetical protein
MVMVKRGDKYFFYDESGKVLIITRSRKVGERYANEQRKLRSKRKRKD